MSKFNDYLEKWEKEEPDIFNFYITIIAVTWFCIGLILGYFLK